MLVLGLCAATSALAGQGRSADPGGGTGIPIPAEACASPGVDSDADGVGDRCETALARAFAPVLVADSTECGWDAGLDRLGGEYLYAVQQVPGGAGRVRIAYLPALYVDCGWRSPVCAVFGGMCRGHDGDSEAVIVEVARGGDSAESGVAGGGERWRTERIFLSAHCHGRSDGRCRWYEGRALRRFRWADGVERGAPVVWVARGKHANYPSRALCDTGWWLRETCDRNRAARRFPVLHARQNVGSRERPFGREAGTDCIGPDFVGWGSRMPVPGTAECFWRPDRPFHGWQRSTPDNTTASYGRYLAEHAGF